MQNLVERMVILAEGERLTLADLTPDILSSAHDHPEDHKKLPLESSSNEQGVRQSLHDIERTEVEAALKTTWLGAGKGREGIGIDPEADWVSDQKI